MLSRCFLVRTFVAICGVFGVGLAGHANADSVTLDGTVHSSEYAGGSYVSVAYDATAPQGNFGAPGNSTSGAAYDIYMTDDGTNLYVGLNITSNASASSGMFTNLYFDTDNGNSSNLGFEITNKDAFIPGVANTAVDTSSTGIQYKVGSDAIEVLIPNTFFTNNPLGMDFTKTSPTGDVTLRLSQSFGYSVAGGSTYGSTRLGEVSLAGPSAAPLPSSAAAGLLLLGGMWFIRAKSKRGTLA